MRLITLSKYNPIREAATAFCAVVMFIFPESCIQAALKGGIVTDYGCWFWIEADGLKVCRRHQLRYAAARAGGGE